MRKGFIVWVRVIIFALALAFVMLGVYQFVKPPTAYEFELAEFSDGVYAYREVVVSSIPAQNYTMATVCLVSGDIITVKGTVHIVNTVDESPHATLESTNIVNGDTITIYAPIDSVVYLSTTSVGRR